RNPQDRTAIISGRSTKHDRAAYAIQRLIDIGGTAKESLVVVTIVERNDGVIAGPKHKWRDRLKRVALDLGIASARAEMNRRSHQQPAGEVEDSNVHPRSVHACEPCVVAIVECAKRRDGDRIYDREVHAESTVPVLQSGSTCTRHD